VYEHQGTKDRRVIMIHNKEKKEWIEKGSRKLDRRKGQERNHRKKKEGKWGGGVVAKDVEKRISSGREER